MGIKQLQKDIRNSGGKILSTDTLNLNDLLTEAYDLICAYNLRTALKTDIESVFENTDKEDTKKLLPTVYNKYYGYVKIPDSKQEEANYLWNEDIYNYFDNIAPKNYYFGSSEGDGACIGYFHYNKEI
jgi:uncharacterized sporulation protein YeaH/YhbH (DUF444 family)